MPSVIALNVVMLSVVGLLYALVDNGAYACSGKLDQGTLIEGEGSIQLTSLYKLCLDQLIFKWEIAYICVTKQATLMRRSAVLPLPLQLMFPGLT